MSQKVKRARQVRANARPPPASDQTTKVVIQIDRPDWTGCVWHSDHRGDHGRNSCCLPDLAQSLGT